ncbi:hypothetical protein Droror1_Dr00014535 [Drosera rotundifolia]
MGLGTILLPKLPIKALPILHFITNKLLAHLGRYVTWSNRQVTTVPTFEPTSSSIHPHPISASAKLICEMLPAVEYSSIVKHRSCTVDQLPESCAICLLEFKGNEQIRPLRNCWHVFHKDCLDPWIDLNQKTCPLCRTHFVPDDLREDFNRWLWSTSCC